MSLLSDYQKIYQFAIVRCQARPFMKKAADMQEEVMQRGLGVDVVPRQVANPTDLSLLNQSVLEGQITTDDEHLKERVKSLQSHDVLILRGDRADSLVFKGESLNEQIMKHHLSCLVVPHDLFKCKVASTYLKRYLAIYVLYKRVQGSFAI
jgi:predicted aminopeptidase